jgi:hypothetical protein
LYFKPWIKTFCKIGILRKVLVMLCDTLTYPRHLGGLTTNLPLPKFWKSCNLSS